MMKRSTSSVAYLLLVTLGAVWLSIKDSRNNFFGTAHASPLAAPRTGQPVKPQTAPPGDSVAKKNLVPIQLSGPESRAVPVQKVDALPPDVEDSTSSENTHDGAFDTAEQQTQAYVEQARKHFSQQHYELAIEELRAAYKLTPKSIFLFNIAQSYRRRGTKIEALNFYKRFIDLDPQNRHANEANNAIIELSAFLKQQDLMEKEKRRPVWKRGWFWAILGTAVGGAALATGLSVGLRSTEGTHDTRGPVILSFN